MIEIAVARLVKAGEQDERVGVLGSVLGRQARQELEYRRSSFRRFVELDLLCLVVRHRGAYNTLVMIPRVLSTPQASDLTAKLTQGRAR